MQIKGIVLILLPAFLIGCGNNEVKNNQLNKHKEIPKNAFSDTASLTTIHWIDSLKALGTVQPGKKTEITFAFENTGKKPLYIVSATPGCGCTIADYPKNAILPGEKGAITATYNAPNEEGQEFRKNISVTTNTKENSNHMLFFYGQIGNKQVKRATGEIK